MQDLLYEDNLPADNRRWVKASHGDGDDARYVWVEARKSEGCWYSL
jgi:hypothetical protein